MADDTAWERRLWEFERAWRSGAPPELEAFVAASDGLADAAARRALWVELACIDLEQRWRRGGPGRPGPDAADYVARFPELADALPDLLEEE